MSLLHSAFPSRCPAVHQKWPPPPTPSPHPPPSAYLFYTGGTVYGAVLLALIAPQVFLQVSEAVKWMPHGGGRKPEQLDCIRAIVVLHVTVHIFVFP